MVSDSLTAYSQILGVGTATHERFYSQNEILEIFRVGDRRIKSLFLNGAIERRSLRLPPQDSQGLCQNETQGELLKKHKECSVNMGLKAINSCLKQAGANTDDISYLCCVTSTGLLIPGLSALLIRELCVRRECSRIDIVGMGCNAGLNGLNAADNWARANSGKLAIMLCVETCSAVYVFDKTMQTAVVNSLFGDGAAAIALISDPKGDKIGPSVLKFSSYIIPEALNAMQLNWDDAHGKYSFFLDPEVPYIIGAHSEQVVDQLLLGTNLHRRDISHWIVHSGGKKVIDSIKVNLRLTGHDLRHTLNVLRDYGNLSSGSFLFSFERLLAEGKVKTGDIGVLMTMGPGSTIEAALVEW